MDTPHTTRTGVKPRKTDTRRPAPRTPRTFEELEADMLASATSLDAGNGADGREVLERLRKHIATITGGK